MLQTPDWSYWLNLSDVEVSEAVALSCNIDPGSYEADEADRYTPVADIPALNAITQRTAVARSHLTARTLPVARSDGFGEKWFVRLGEFRAWGESLPHPFTFPDGFPQANTKNQTSAPSAAAPSDEKPLDQRERTTLLAIIRALDGMAKLPARAASTSVERQLRLLGFSKPGDAAIRNVIEQARALEPDGKPQ